jgi:uncharacterized membrane protein
MKKYFLTGLVILLPLVLTILIVIFLVNVLTKPFIGMVEWMLKNATWAAPLYERPGMENLIHYVSQIFVLILLVGFCILLGMIARWFFFKSLIRMGDFILHRIPIVNKVYRTTQEIIKTIFGDRAKSFKTVVMVPFPLHGTYSIGLVAGDAPPKCKAGAKSDLLSVFVPTTPNPTSGYLIMVPREECIFVDMKVEEAIKFIISCGVVHHGNEEEEPEIPPEVDTSLS